MNRHHLHRIISCLIFIATLPPSSACAGSIDLPNNFTAGTPARAAQVNANFSAVKTAVDDNDSRITGHDARVGQLESQVATLQAQLAALQEYIDDLQTAMTLQIDAQGNPAVMFDGVNVHIRNGSGSTGTVNGRGNLIIGYDEIRTVVSEDYDVPHCSDGAYNDQPNCEANEGVWQLSHKSGSHNVVIGPYHNYSRYGGLVAGNRNTLNGIGASISGGFQNKASAIYSSVSGGGYNVASGDRSSVSGGGNNTASNVFSSISGGQANTASAGGSSVSGGRLNAASAIFSTVSGGNSRTASGTDDWVAGGLLESE